MTLPSPSRYLRTLWLVALGAAVVSACGGDDSDGSANEEPACEMPKPWPDAAASAEGLVQCADGVIHRSAAPSCTAATPPDLDPSDPAAMNCKDVECAQQPNGFCVATIGSSPDLNTTGCVYPCASDDDCMEGTACFCGPSGGECIPAACRAASDCGKDPCILMYGKLECGEKKAPELTCLTADRDCAADKACPEDQVCIDGSCKPAANTCP